MIPSQRRTSVQRVKIISFTLLTLFCFFPASNDLEAGEVYQVTPLSFGSIDLNPSGDTILIAAKNGAASPTSFQSVVTGGNSGQLTLRSTTVEHVDIVYPSSVPISGGGDILLITHIADNSQYTGVGVDLPGGNIPVTVSVGGQIKLKGNEDNRTFSGSMTINLFFN